MLHASCIVAEIGGDRCFLAEKNGNALQKCMQIATCNLTHVQCRTRVKQLDTYILLALFLQGF